MLHNPSQSASEVQTLPAAVKAILTAMFAPSGLWLFGSRARGDHRPDSDWDVVVVVDDAQSHLADPLVQFEATVKARDAGFNTTVLVTTKSDLHELWGMANTIGYDLKRDGIPIDVTR